jgi:hypothetical protein
MACVNLTHRMAGARHAVCESAFRNPECLTVVRRHSFFVVITLPFCVKYAAAETTYVSTSSAVPVKSSGVGVWRHSWGQFWSVAFASHFVCPDVSKTETVFIFRSKTKKQERDLLGPFARTVLCHWTSISLPTGPPQYGPSLSEHQNTVAWKPRHSEQCFRLIMRLNVISSRNVSTITPHVFPIHIQVREACVVFVLQVYSLLLFKFSYWCSRLLFLVGLPRSSGLIPFLHETVAFWYPVNFYKMRRSCNCLWHIHVTSCILKSGCSRIQGDPHFELQYLSTRQ